MHDSTLTPFFIRGRVEGRGVFFAKRNIVIIAQLMLISLVLTQYKFEKCFYENLICDIHKIVS